MPLKSKIINFFLILINFGLILSNIAVSLKLNSLFYDPSSKKTYFNKTFQSTLFLTIFGNVIPILLQFTLKFHVDILPESIEKMKFWLPFFSKQVAYTILLITNLNIFMSQENAVNILTNFTAKFEKDSFVCREDQAAYNLIIFV